MHAVSLISDVIGNLQLDLTTKSEKEVSFFSNCKNYNIALLAKFILGDFTFLSSDSTITLKFVCELIVKKEKTVVILNSQTENEIEKKSPKLMKDVRTQLRERVTKILEKLQSKWIDASEATKPKLIEYAKKSMDPTNLENCESWQPKVKELQNNEIKILKAWAQHKELYDPLSQLESKITFCNSKRNENQWYVIGDSKYLNILFDTLKPKA